MSGLDEPVSQQMQTSVTSKVRQKNFPSNHTPLWKDKNQPENVKCKFGLRNQTTM